MPGCVYRQFCICVSFFLVPANKLALRRSTDFSSLLGPTTDNTLMDGCLNTVVHLEVKLGEGVLLVGRGLLDITKTGCIYNVPYNETLDGLILGDGLSGGSTPDTLYVTAALFITSVRAPLNSHDLISPKKSVEKFRLC
mmetsp:Transcript_20164/g.26599  ORF Transcript_20164/g.26599 Transcript_20164/m.26599 type:complete len:139 (-) Transcript_20164:85-501(-)